MKKSLFITFEGIEGSGKSTQIALLAEYIKARGYEVTVTCEPGGTTVGEAIRRILLNPEFAEMDYHTEVLLYAADRAQHVAELIMPALNKGNIVISDRYIDSSIAYQHFGRGMPLDLIMDVNDRATQGLKPNITFLLVVPTELGLSRATQVKADRIEQESIEFHTRVEAGFQELAAKEPGRWLVVDGTRSVDEIHQVVVEALEPFL
ncbi:MAG: dTMP kinase [Actinobacteria bacterium]|nr:dTMP kinase [Actinomycetota bacterium]